MQQNIIQESSEREPYHRFPRPLPPPPPKYMKKSVQIVDDRTKSQLFCFDILHSVSEGCRKNYTGVKSNVIENFTNILSTRNKCVCNLCYVKYEVPQYI
jgi:hypothetical protein